MMKINNNVLAKVLVWQGFSGINRLNSHSSPRRRTRERLPSDSCIESELPRSRLTGTVVPFASDTASVTRTQSPDDRLRPREPSLRAK